MDFGGHCQPIRRRLHAAKSRIVAGQFVVPVVQPLKKQVNTMSKIRDHDNRTDSRQAVGYRCAAWNSGFSVSPKRTRVPDRQHCISRLTNRKTFMRYDQDENQTRYVSGVPRDLGWHSGSLAVVGRFLSSTQFCTDSHLLNTMGHM